MHYPRMVALVYLEKFLIKAKGHLNGPYLFYFDISHPRPSVAGRVHELVVEEQVGEEIDFSQRSLRDRLIFKEIVEGPFSLGISIAPVDKAHASEMTEIIKRLGAEISSRFLNLRFHTLNKMMDLVQSVGITDFESALSNSIGVGTESFTPVEEKSFKLKIPLATPTDLRNPYPDRGRRHEDYEEFLKRSGEDNGFVEFKVDILER